MPSNSSQNNVRYKSEFFPKERESRENNWRESSEFFVFRRIDATEKHLAAWNAERVSHRRVTEAVNRTRKQDSDVREGYSVRERERERERELKREESVGRV